MRITHTALPDVLLIDPAVYSDDRGFLVELFNERRFAGAGLPAHFVLELRSHSRANVIRALHFQGRSPQGKLVTAVSGEIFDVAVDIRVGSPTFGKWAGVTLRASAPQFFWIPPGFAHGFAVLSDTADVVYKCTSAYEPDEQRGIRWNDPAIGIPWPTSKPRLSGPDQQHPMLEDVLDSLPRFTP